MANPIPSPIAPLAIGVAGGSGSGKTTVSRAIMDRVGARYIAYLEHDAYYYDINDIPRAGDELINFDHPDSLETSLLIEHIKQLKAWHSVEIPIYDFTTYRRTEQRRCIEPQPIILIEGILVFVEPELRQLFDVRIFVDTDPDIRFIRRLTRDITERARTVESVIDQYLRSVRPMHLDFVEPSKRYADVIIPQGGHNLVAIDMVAARVKNMLNTSDSPRPTPQTTP